jgi:uncharacterized protein with NAD-binding domain and iron-sulfur cluster
MPASQPLKKIAILGGGLGSLTTAFALTSRRNWREHYEITVYQMGWRLGGKGASGRNPEPGCGHRIEEHGFHVWLGFYDNAFKMIQESYAELARTTGPLRTWTDAFKKHSLVVIQEVIDGERKQWQIKFPEGIRTPGTVVRLGLFGYAARMFKLLYDGLPATPTRGPASIAPVLRLWQTIWRTAFIALLLCLSVAEYFLRLLENRVRRQLEETRGSAARHVLRPLHRLLAWVVRSWRTIVEASSQLVMAWADGAQVSNPDDGRRLQIFFDLSLAVLRGIIVDDIVAKGFESIDHLEFKAWLLQHNARPESVNSAIITSIYDGNFCFTGGDRTRPNFAAGVALNCFLRIFLDYKGALLYKMQAGMGDVVIAPLYEVLKKRGVQFKFFHRIDELVYDAVAGRISAIELTEQVILNGDYDPLVKVDVAGGQIDCWPSQPRYEFIKDGEELKTSAIDLESQWASPWKDSRQTRLIHGTDYDLVVLGISIGALGGICRQLVAQRPEWEDMIRNVDTVATQAMQLWLSPGLEALGWPLPTSLVVNFESPGANWLDSSQVSRFECLPAAEIGSIAYLCSVLQDPPEIPPARPSTFPVDQRNGVRTAHERWLAQHSAGLWPALTNLSGPAPAVRWDLLHDPQNRQGLARLDWHYFRANVEPSDRFVLSSVGATRFRLRPEQSGVANLYLTGDWTHNKFNAGCVEATVMSGLLCSRAIAGYPRRIFGERPFGIFGV